jgi:myo-inositol catabolism protein IolC
MTELEEVLSEEPVVRGAVVKGTEGVLETVLEAELVLVSEVDVNVGSTVADTLSLDEVEIELEEEVDEEEVVVTTGTDQTLIHSLLSQISGAEPVSVAAQAASSAVVSGNSFPHQHSREYSIPK